MSDQPEQEMVSTRKLAVGATADDGRCCEPGSLAIVAGAVRAAEHDRIAGLLKAPSPASAPVSTSQAPQLPSFAGLAQRVTPAVVSVHVSAEETGGITIFGGQAPGEDGFPPGSPFEYFFRQFGQQGLDTRPHLVQAQGSGFFISPDGYILTNNHALTRQEREGEDRRRQELCRWAARTDPKTDLVLVK
jgi:serine protease Do